MIASVTVGKEVSVLFPDVINCIQTDKSLTNPAVTNLALSITISLLVRQLDSHYGMGRWPCLAQLSWLWVGRRRICTGMTKKQKLIRMV